MNLSQIGSTFDATQIRHSLGKLIKCVRLHRIMNYDAWWLEREYEIYRKYSGKYADIISEGVPEQARASSNKVWILWLQGIEKAPDLVKACYNSIIKQLPDKDVTVLTADSLDDFVSLPGYVYDRYRRGIISAAHFSDIVRMNLLVNNGGTWVDSTVLLTGDNLPRYSMNLPLFVFKQINLSNKDLAPIVASSWYISGQSHSGILGLTQKLIWKYWETHSRLKHYFLFHIFFAIACRRYPEEWTAVPTFNNVTPHEMMFELGDEYRPDRWRELCNATDIHKLTRHIEFGNASNYQHILDEWGSS